MQARIELLPQKKLIGKQQIMSFSNHNPQELWSLFMPLKKNIVNSVGTELYSIEVYPEDYFTNYNPKNTFTKWAAVAVEDFEVIPENLETIVFPEGLYAVFTHIGLPLEAVKTYTAIFTKWLPNSKYQLDNRPHFAVMDKKYKPNDPTAEEEIWIPIKAL